MVSVRNAAENDIEIIQQLAEQTWWPTYSPILEKHQIEYMLSHIYSVEAMRQVMKDKSQHFILISENGIDQGFASYGTWSEDPACLKIFKLYVLPNNQGKGLGKKLISEIAERAAKDGKTSLILNVNRNNPALTFYKKEGFELLRNEDIPIGPYWMNDHVLRLQLQPK